LAVAVRLLARQQNISSASVAVLDRRRGAVAHVTKTITAAMVKAASAAEPKRPTKAEAQRPQRQADRKARFRAAVDLAQAGPRCRPSCLGGVRGVRPSIG
jgi:hypothetical protein